MVTPNHSHDSNRRSLVIVLAALMVLSLACQATTPETPPPAAVEVILVTATQPVAAPAETAAVSEPAPTATQALLPSPTSLPEPTVSPTAVSQPTPAQVPDAPLSASGPWGIVQDGLGLWAVNADGSGLTQLTKIVPSKSDEVLPSPAGGMLAFIYTKPGWQDPLLERLTLPRAILTAMTGLLPNKPGLTPDDPASPVFEAVRAFMENPALAWSPDGSRLAYVSAKDGPSADLYLLEGEASFTRLTDGPSQAYGPIWSPDGRYLVHAGAQTFGTGAGFKMAGVWSIDTNDKTYDTVLTLYNPTSSGEEWDGWLAEDNLLVHSFEPSCGSTNLRSYQVSEARPEPVVYWPEFFNQAVVDPQGKSILLLVDSFMAGCNRRPESGVFLFAPGQTQPQKLMDTSEAVAEWTPELGEYLVLSEGTLFAIRQDGKVNELTQQIDLLPFPAPGGSYLAWGGTNYSDQKGVWVAPVTGESGSLSLGEVQEVYNQPVSEIQWAPDGQSLFFISDGVLYVAHAPGFFPVPVSASLSIAPGTGLVWVDGRR